MNAAKTANRRTPTRRRHLATRRRSVPRRLVAPPRRGRNDAAASRPRDASHPKPPSIPSGRRDRWTLRLVRCPRGEPPPPPPPGAT